MSVITSKYITKYVLTEGIVESPGEYNPKTDTFGVVNMNGYKVYYHRPFFHDSLDQAIIHANQIKSKKLSSLHRQLQKIEKLNF